MGFCPNITPCSAPLSKRKSPVGPSDVTGHKAFPEPQVKAPVPCCCASQLCTFLTSGYLSSCWLWTGIYLVLLIPEIRKGRAQGLAHSGIPVSVSKHNRQTNKLTESGSKRLLQCSKKKKRRRVLILKIHRVYLQIIQIKGRQLD